MEIIKFGGKSLSNGEGIENVVSIIADKINNKKNIAIILSARKNTTDELEGFLEMAKQGIGFSEEWDEFKEKQIKPFAGIDFNKEFQLLEKIFEGVKLVGDYSLKTKDLVLAQGEILSTKLIAEILRDKGIKSKAVDSREFLKTNSAFGNAQILEEISSRKTIDFFSSLEKNTVPVITGFIASTITNETTTLGRNGSNYTASIIAKYLNANSVQSYTHINGIYTANPDQVKDSRIIEQMTFKEANELASFGASILHSKTIEPLAEKKIPLQILNSFVPGNKGTLIHNEIVQKGIKSIAIQEDVGFINIEGSGFLGKKGIDARIFGVLNLLQISVGVISQGSSERSIGFIISKEHITKAIAGLKEEFSAEFVTKGISSIKAINDISVITVIGQNINGFSNAFKALIKNDVHIILINNTLSGNNISLVVEKADVSKTVNIIHSHIFGVAKNINIAIFGKGTVGKSLIDQILKSKENILKRKEIKLNVFAIVGTQGVLLNSNGITENWESDYENSAKNSEGIKQVSDYAKQHHLENLIAIDNTASTDFTKNYIPLIENGFDLVSSNKIANTQSYATYVKLRESLKTHNKQYLYETNVGAGLPLIDTINLLHTSGENITRIKGVFSGSLSYLFNQFSITDKPFSEILKEAIDLGFTEPDPREDLCGNDVARKLLILARELDLENEFDEIRIENLIPQFLRDGPTDSFLYRLEELDTVYQEIKNKQKPGHVLRYLGDLSGDLQQRKGNLSVKLVSVAANSPVGNLTGSDSIFEIYTESYGDNPIVIQGAGAGAEVTARGVFGDLLRISDKK